MKKLKCRKCGDESSRTLFDLRWHWNDAHGAEHKQIRQWLDQDIDEVKRLERKAAAGLRGYWAGDELKHLRGNDDENI